MSRVAGAAQDGLPPVGAEGEVLQVVGGEWAPAAAPAGDLSTATGTLGIDHGGTGATTAAGARQALLPAANTGKALVSDGSDASFTTLAIDAGTTGTLPLSRGGTGATAQAAAANAILPAQASNANKLLFSDGANASWALVSLASSVSGQLPTANGGTGLSSSGSDGFVLRSNGTSWASAQLALADTSGTLATARGGTGLTSSGVAGRVLRSDGSVWQSAQLAFADLSGTSGVALLDSPVFINNPTAPTPAVGDSNGTLATTAFVQEALRNIIRRSAGGINEVDDFISSTTTSGDLPWATSANGAGTSIGPANAVANGAIGYRSFTAGTAATGRAAYTRSELVSTQAAFVTPWLDGTLTLAFRIQIPVLPTLGADFPVYSFSLGTGLAVASDHFVNGIGLRYARNVTDQWVLASRSAGADVASANTSFTPTAGVWHWLVIVMSGASATCYIGTTYAAALAAGVRATITTTGAYSSMLSPLMKINNTAGTTNARVVLVDTYALDFNLTTPR